MTEPNYVWLLLTLISRLKIRKEESGRPQAVVLSFLRATHDGRRASAKVKFCKFLQAGRSARLSNRAMFKIILILIPWQTLSSSTESSNWYVTCFLPLITQNELTHDNLSNQDIHRIPKQRLYFRVRNREFSTTTSTSSRTAKKQ